MCGSEREAAVRAVGPMARHSQKYLPSGSHDDMSTCSFTFALILRMSCAPRLCSLEEERYVQREGNWKPEGQADSLRGVLGPGSTFSESGSGSEK